jgi:hypothetical protein
MKKRLALWLALISLIILALPYAVLALHALPMEDVSSNMADQSVSRTFQRSTFYGSGRAWAFFMGYDAANNSHIYYRSSSDGINWLSRTFVCDVLDADEFSLFWDGTYLHTVWVANDGIQNGVSYRRGTPNSSGTITWGTTQEVYIPSITDVYVLPTITAYGGIPYIAYGHTVGPTQVWGATASNQTNGTWLQDADFENADLVAGNATVAACIDALPANGIIHVTIESVVPPALFPEVGAMRYTAGAWQPYETIINTAAFGDSLCSTVPWGLVMNVITNFVPGNDISHRQSAPGGFWAIAPAATVISPNSYIHATVSIWNNANGDLKCFFSDGLPGDISWKFYDNALATWDVTFFPLVTAHSDKLNSAQIHSSPLGVVYENDLAPDSDVVYYDYLDSFPAQSPVIANYAMLMFMIIAIIFLIVAFYVRHMLQTATDTGMTASEKSDVFISMAILIAVGIVIIMIIANR